MPPNAEYGGHAARIYPEILDDGMHGSDPADRQTRRVWVSGCKCGWAAGSGVGLFTFDTRWRARHAYRIHTSPVVRQAGDSPLDLSHTTSSGAVDV